MSPATIRMPPDYDSFDTFLSIVQNRLNLAGSPGLPFCRVYPTNRDFLMDGVGNWRHDRIYQLWDMVKRRLSGDLEPFPLRTFIKPEPHKLSKIEDGQLRIIMSVSLADQIIDHMLMDPINDSMVRCYGRIPVLPGWAPVRGGWRIIPLKEQCIGLDRRAWDWNAPRWLIWAEKEVRKNLVLADAKWENLVDSRYHELFVDPLIQTSGGDQFRQAIPGIVKSGCVNTISMNSIMQVILHCVVLETLGLPDIPIYAMGDDTIQTVLPAGYQAELQKYVLLKEPVLGEFCSFIFDGGRVESTNFQKHLYAMAFQADAKVKESLQSLQLVYGRSDRLEFWRRVAAKWDPTAVLSKSFIRQVFDGDC